MEEKQWGPAVVRQLRDEVRSVELGLVVVVVVVLVAGWMGRGDSCDVASLVQPFNKPPRSPTPQPTAPQNKT